MDETKCNSNSSLDCSLCKVEPVTNNKRCCGYCTNTKSRCNRLALANNAFCLQHSDICNKLLKKYKEYEELLDRILNGELNEMLLNSLECSTILMKETKFDKKIACIINHFLKIYPKFPLDRKRLQIIYDQLNIIATLREESNLKCFINLECTTYQKVHGHIKRVELIMSLSTIVEFMINHIDLLLYTINPEKYQQREIDSSIKVRNSELERVVPLLLRGQEQPSKFSTTAAQAPRYVPVPPSLKVLSPPPLLNKVPEPLKQIYSPPPLLYIPKNK